MAYIKPSSPGLHTVVETPKFLIGARRVLTDAERAALVDFSLKPRWRATRCRKHGGARKLRWAAKGKGKSGGARAITFYSGRDLPVFLMTVFGKGEKNLTKTEQNELRDVLARIAAEYRKGVRRRV